MYAIRSYYEHLLHALASCITTSLVYHAAAREIPLEGVESYLEGELDLRGFLGLDPTVRKGFKNITVKVRLTGNLTDKQKEEVVKLGPHRITSYNVCYTKLLRIPRKNQGL